LLSKDIGYITRRQLVDKKPGMNLSWIEDIILAFQ